jgi:hypothetical protein
LISSAQGFFLGLLKKRGAFFVQFLDALDGCFVCHAIAPAVRQSYRGSNGIETAAAADPSAYGHHPIAPRARRGVHAGFTLSSSALHSLVC